MIHCWIIQVHHVKHYFISFRDYVRDNNAYSLLEEKQIIMNYGDVLLGIDGVDKEGKHFKMLNIAYSAKQKALFKGHS
jgi:hypothetical protein